MSLDGINTTNGLNAGTAQTSGSSKKNQQQVSIFGDKNNNGIVDKNDFADEKTAQIAQEKGLIGRKWESVKESIAKLINTNAKEKGLTSETRYNEATKENYKADIKNGQEIKRTYYKADGSIDEIINLDYDENGNISSKVSVNADGNLKHAYNYKDNEIDNFVGYDDKGNMNLYIEYENGKSVRATGYNDGYIVNEEYDANENLKNRTISYTGDIPSYDDGNMAEISKTMNDARNKLPVGGKEGSEAFDEVISKIFGDNLKSIDTMRDGGSLEIRLNDGSMIYMDNQFLVGDGSLTITKPDGTKEKYSSEGQKTE